MQVVFRVFQHDTLFDLIYLINTPLYIVFITFYNNNKKLFGEIIWRNINYRYEEIDIESQSLRIQ